MEEPSGSSESAVIKAAAGKKSPGDFLKQVIGKPVIVKLHSGITYRGVLACLDGFMNIAMEQTEEYVDGQLTHKYGDCFIRGNNGKSAHSPYNMLCFDDLFILSFSIIYKCC
jgi:U6 snRNA-associated Sm-like protein LSm6